MPSIPCNVWIRILGIRVQVTTPRSVANHQTVDVSHKFLLRLPINDATKPGGT